MGNEKYARIVFYTNLVEKFYYLSCCQYIKRRCWLIRNNDRVANFCNDVVGDVAGTLSGAIGAGIVVSLSSRLGFIDLVLGGSVMTSLIAALAAAKGPVILVSNEVGLGLVPETPLGRDFRDAQGRLNQAVAAIVPNVVFIAAGLPLRLKGTGA